MKNILIISFFHSSQHHVGAIRTQRFAQYLPDFGWKPYVLTKLPLTGSNGQTLTDGDDTFYAPSIPLNKPFHLESLIWVPFMLRKAINLLRKIPIEVILISCPPFHQAIAGVLLKKWFRIKFVVDYRDAWGLNPYRQRLNSLKRFMLQGDKALENWLLQHTDLLIVSHQEMKEQYLRHFKFLEGRIEVVYNGFDPEKIGSSKETLFPQFTILHLGNFYTKQKTRDPGLFLTALQSVISQNGISKDQLRVLFIGEKYSEVEELIASKGLSAYVSYLNRVSHDVAMEYLNKSHVLLLIETLDVMTTKVYEYLATGKPMLCLIRKGGDLESIIRHFSLNSTIIFSENVDEIKEAVWKSYEDYKKGEYRSFLNEEFRKSFSRMEQTRHMVHLLDRIIRH